MNTRTSGRLRQVLGRADLRLFEQVARRSWPGADRVLPRLSKSADHGLLWFGVGAGMWAVGGVRGRRAAVRAVASLALASATVNTLAKGAVRRERPLIDVVPVVRHLARRPITSSFPSGHSASAAAFAAGAALESRGWGAALLPVAASVAFSRVYTGVHYPSDVVVGALLGVGAAAVLKGPSPNHTRQPPPARPRVDAPALPEGEGLVVVVNPSSGSQPQLTEPARQIETSLPKAEVVRYDESAGPLPEVLDRAAADAAARGGALGVCGGDGTVNAAVAPALRYGVPLLVLPGGTFNHFAADLGVETLVDGCAAVTAGQAVQADVGRVRRLSPAGVAPKGAPDPDYFLNTFSLGVYPELVRLRERWSPRIGGTAAAVVGTVKVLRGARPLRASVNGVPRSMWLLFAGNGAYRSIGLAPVRREEMADGLLDVRVAHGGRFARTRLLATALAGGVARTRVYASARPHRVRITGLPADTPMACDGEVMPAPADMLIDKLPKALTVYRPVDG
ncbi:phosphatase PAP2 family protein [Streptomyces sp. NPDC048577]|uniref:bifunctional phosphatase PAP2/diacylglycerol kinase family protein n=1 Tax=Streptomyces sp. NPDC048577 TaxID=3157209 RepID=UPI0034220617